jgi:cytochrome c
VIPGIDQPRGVVGPPLDAFARRTFIAGVIPNTPVNLMRWVIDPQAIDPRTAMPSVGLTQAEAQDVAAYLYTLD